MTHEEPRDTHSTHSMKPTHSTKSMKAMKSMKSTKRMKPAKGPAIFLSTTLLIGALVAVENRAVESRSAREKPTAPPRVIDAGDSTKPPSDAIVLFDGKDLAKEFTNGKGGAPGWIVENGVATVQGGSIHSRRKFGDIQMHLEFRTPAGSTKGGESRGNSGIKFHEAYEIQVLDNYKHQSSIMGQCASVYKQHPPLVNACRPPGEWQTYDIIFRAPYFDEKGKEIRFGTFTVLHNGVLVQDNAEIWDGRTNSRRPVSADYKQPFFIQDHGSKVSYRNIWVREIERKPLREK